MGHEIEVRLFIRRGGQDGLAEAEPIGAKFALDLRAVKLEGNFERGEKVIAEEDAVAGFHVQEFDGEDVGGTFELIAGEEQGWVIAFLDPPFGYAVESFELG